MLGDDHLAASDGRDGRVGGGLGLARQLLGPHHVQVSLTHATTHIELAQCIRRQGYLREG